MNLFVNAAAPESDKGMNALLPKRLHQTWKRVSCIYCHALCVFKESCKVGFSRVFSLITLCLFCFVCNQVWCVLNLLHFHVFSFF